MFKFIPLLFLLLAVPSWAQYATFIPSGLAIQDTSPSSGTCNSRQSIKSQESFYSYFPCNGNDGSTPWGGGNFDWKFPINIPAGITTPYVDFYAVFEPRLNYVGGDLALEFQAGMIVLTDACNVGTTKTYCSSSSTIEPSLDYTMNATAFVASGGKCQGATDTSGTDDDTTCDADNDCTSANQVCVGKLQVTSEDSNPYLMQVVSSSDNFLHDCTSGTCAGHKGIISLRLYIPDSPIERDWRLVGLIVAWNR